MNSLYSVLESVLLDDPSDPNTVKPISKVMKAMIIDYPADPTDYMRAHLETLTTEINPDKRFKLPKADFRFTLANLDTDPTYRIAEWLGTKPFGWIANSSDSDRKPNEPLSGAFMKEMLTADGKKHTWTWCVESYTERNNMVYRVALLRDGTEWKAANIVFVCEINVKQ